MRTVAKIILLLILLGGAAAGGYWWYQHHEAADDVTYRKTKVERGDMLATIGATGTVEPEEVIDVGAQVAGQINFFGKDKSGKTIDYNSVVEEGTILAQIDDSTYLSDVAAANAQLAQARAGVVRAEADLVQLKAKRVQAQNDWERAQKLGPSEALAQTSYDAYRAAYDSAAANVGVGEASITQAQAAVAQADAALVRAKRNLGYTTIKSPVKGVVIDRRVNIGQTVVASLNAPSLFLLAKDLQRMQVWVAVNEADIGQIHAGQPVTFTIDASDDVFKGQVGKVRLNASMTQNVVTYTVEVLTDNSSGKLMPYRTANVQFEVSRKSDVLKIPNAALRWTPPANRIAPGVKPDPAPAQGEKRKRRGADASQAAKDPPRGTFWIEDGDFLRPVHAKLGMTDGVMREVSGDDVKEGMEVILGEEVIQEASDGTTNPFAPQFMRRRPTTTTSIGTSSTGSSTSTPPPRP
ncbi:MAG: HlyD family efflux transporter periplasmic adaptor subunit [Planctomycetes bacterium]|nr:HlyD family efflux transporter periplasmic adaptor subunit [Planctomycetota bacterium]